MEALVQRPVDGLVQLLVGAGTAVALSTEALARMTASRGKKREKAGERLFMVLDRIIGWQDLIRESGRKRGSKVKIDVHTTNSIS